MVDDHTIMVAISNRLPQQQSPTRHQTSPLRSMDNYKNNKELPVKDRIDIQVYHNRRSNLCIEIP